MGSMPPIPMQTPLETQCTALRAAARRSRLALCAAALLAAAVAQAEGFSYTVIHVDGGLATQPSGINEAGVIVGSYQQPQGRNSVVLRPFVLKEGVPRIVRAVEPAVLSYDDINNSGHLVVNVTHRDFSTEARLERGHRRTALAIDGAVNTYAYGLNDDDVVVGAYDHDPDPLGILRTSGYVWSTADGFTTFDAPGATGRLTIAWDVNTAGTAVGVYADEALVYHGFVRMADGRFTTIDVTGAPYTQLMGINAQGHIVGFYQDPNDWTIKGFVYRHGRFELLSPPDGALGVYPYRITEDGRVVGWTMDSQGLTRGFLATPGAAR
jgi:hypothetical protein